MISAILAASTVHICTHVHILFKTLGPWHPVAQRAECCSPGSSLFVLYSVLSSTALSDLMRVGRVLLLGEGPILEPDSQETPINRLAYAVHGNLAQEKNIIGPTMVLT